jgi:hypothetical protein
MLGRFFLLFETWGVRSSKCAVRESYPWKQDRYGVLCNKYREKVTQTLFGLAKLLKKSNDIGPWLEAFTGPRDHRVLGFDSVDFVHFNGYFPLIMASGALIEGKTRAVPQLAASL